MRKPFSVEELDARIKNLLELAKSTPRSEAKPEGQINLGEYVFDHRKYELIHDTGTRRLSHREAELLKILIEHKDTSVERQHILKSIWGDDSFFNSRNLDVYITKLRSYLKGDPKIKIITLKGIGYQFIVD